MEGKGKVLVTGGAGYIGSHTVVELVAAGYDTVIVDNLVNSERSATDGVAAITGRDIPFYQIDCCDRSELAQVFDKHRFDAVIHFAALKSVPESVTRPLEYYRNNLVSLLNVMGLVRDYNVHNIVFSSSASVYGEADRLPVTEAAPRKPAASPYGHTKQLAEDLLRESTAEGLRVIALRYFNPIGAHPSGLIGELPRGVPGNLVPFITQTAAGVQPFLRVFGNDYPTPDGSALRDYIDIIDLAQAHVAALGRMSGGMAADYEIFNVGTGIPCSVLELIRVFEETNGVKVPFEIVGRRPGDVAELWADPSLANRELGWEAKRSLTDSLTTAWQWEKRLRGL